MLENLKAIRRRVGFRQIDVACRANCSVGMVWLAENGYWSRVSPKLKKKIAQALGCKVEDIFLEPETRGTSRKKGRKNL